MKETANIAEGIPATAGAVGMFSPAIAAAPIRTAATLAGGTIGGGAGRLIGETAGLSPENTQSLEDVGTLGGGMAGNTAPEHGSWLARATRNAETGKPRIPVIAGTDVRPIADAVLPTRTIEPPAQKIAAAREQMYNDLARARVNRGIQQDRLDRAGRLSAVSPATGEAIPEGRVLHLPEPNEPMPGEKPGTMYSVKRKTVLLPAAQRGKAGAADVLRDQGQPMIIIPKEAGYPGPRVERPTTARIAPPPAESITGRKQAPVARFTDEDEEE
jgi:hypothetical protein